MRTKIPEDIEAEVMFQHDRTCCVCHEARKRVQIHHIDGNRDNHSIDNLAALCFDHHDDTQIRGGFGRTLKAAEVIKYRDDWLRRVRERREAADRMLFEQMKASLPAPPNSSNWVRPPVTLLAALVDNLPNVLQRAYRGARPMWASPVRTDMMDGCQLVRDILEQSWARLCAWLPPNYFDGRTAGQFLSELLSLRYSYHLALGQPEGPMTAGTGVYLDAEDATMRDAEQAIVDVVRALGFWFLKDFDFDTWLARWEAGKTETLVDGSPTHPLPSD